MADAALAALLAATSLTHLTDALAGATLASLQDTHAAGGRTKLLSALKELGVAKVRVEAPGDACRGVD